MIILRTPDDLVFRVFRDIWEALGSPTGAQYTVQLAPSTNYGAGNLTFSGSFAERDSSEPLREILGKGVTLASALTFTVPTGVTVSVTRQPTQDDATLDLPDQLQALLAVQVLAAFRTGFQAYGAGGSLTATLNPELAEFYNRREQGLLRLEGLTQRLVEQNTAYREQLDREIAVERRQDAERMAAERAKVREQAEEEAERLRARAAELDAERQKLDDRSNTHARRELRAELKSALASTATSFHLTPGTARKRWPIHALFILLLAFVGFEVVDAIRRLDAIATASMPWQALAFVALRFVVTAASFIGATAFYIRWNDRWANEHAAEEFRQRRMALDVDRASWIVEMALEWNEEKQAEIPPELLDRLSRNLFRDDGGAEVARHPAEDLTSTLLRAATGLKVNVPGLGEATFDRKGIERIEDSAKRQNGSAG